MKDVLHHKGSQVWAVHPETKVLDALRLMGEKNIGALVVVDKEDKLQGIFSERDYARYVVKDPETSSCPWELPVSELMSRNIIYVTEDKSVDYCMGLMTSKRLRHLPVMGEGKLQGLISIGDAVKAELNRKNFIIDQMEHYIWDNS